VGSEKPYYDIDSIQFDLNSKYWEVWVIHKLSDKSCLISWLFTGIFLWWKELTVFDMLESPFFDVSCSKDGFLFSCWSCSICQVFHWS
jgi:hypothetical protein